MSQLVPVTLQDVRTLIAQMLSNPADQVRLASSLQQLVQQLPPARSEVMSRYKFERAGLWSYVANFFDAEDDQESVPEIIRIPHDSWIRGVQAFALPALDEDRVTADGLLLTARQRSLLATRYGSNWRGLFEVNWRINSRQGFISTGTGEILATAAQATGDGQYSANLDWRLQQEDTIEVRVRNRIRRVFPTDCVTALDRVIPWICVIFWAEELPQPAP